MATICFINCACCSPGFRTEVKLVPVLHNYFHILPARQLQHPELLLFGNEFQHLDQLLFPHELEPTEHYCLLQLQNYHSVTCLSLISIGKSSAGARIKLTSIPIHDKMIHLLPGILLSFSCGLWLVACGLWHRVYNVVK